MKKENLKANLASRTETQKSENLNFKEYELYNDCLVHEPLGYEESAQDLKEAMYRLNSKEYEWKVYLRTHEKSLYSCRSDLRNIIFSSLDENFNDDAKILFKPDQNPDEKNYIWYKSKYIDLNNKLIYKIDPRIGQFLHLIELKLSDNLLEYLPSEIGDLCGLKILDLSNNRLKALPISIGLLSHLNELNLSGNKLKDLPPTMSGLEKLKIVDIQRNEFDQLPEQLLGCSQLTDIKFSHNEIKKISFEFLKMLPFLRSKEFNRNIGNVYDGSSYKNFSSKHISLEEKCLRRIVSKKLDIPKNIPHHLINKIRSAKECFCCGEPYFDYWSEITSKKYIGNNKVIVFYEFLCTNHKYTNQVRNLNYENRIYRCLGNVKRDRLYPRITEIFSIYSYSKLEIDKRIEDASFLCLDPLYKFGIDDMKNKTEPFFKLAFGFDALRFPDSMITQHDILEIPWDRSFVSKYQNLPSVNKDWFTSYYDYFKRK